MIFELVVTSVKRALQAGRTGFAPVMRTRGMHPDLQQRLEAVSGYRHAFPQGDPRNPVIRAHSVVDSAAGRFNVLSRIVDAGSDHTGRSNKVAHHIACDAGEIRAAGRSSPAALLIWLEQRGLFSSRWDADPQERPAPASFPYPPVTAGRCAGWERFGGDAGWAGVLVDRALKGQPTWIICNPGIDMLPLFAEALALVEPARRWGISFTTLALADKGFLWMAAAEGSAEAKAARGQAGSLVIDLGRPGPAPDSGPYAQSARGLAEVPWAAKAVASAAPRGPVIEPAPAVRQVASPIGAPAASRVAPPPMIGGSAPPGMHPPGMHPPAAIGGSVPPPAFDPTPAYGLGAESDPPPGSHLPAPSRRSRPNRTPFYVAAGSAAMVLLLLVGLGIEYAVRRGEGFTGSLVALVTPDDEAARRATAAQQAAAQQPAAQQAAAQQAAAQQAAAQHAAAQQAAAQQAAAQQAAAQQAAAQQAAAQQQEQLEKQKQADENELRFKKFMTAISKKGFFPAGLPTLQPPEQGKTSDQLLIGLPEDVAVDKEIDWLRFVILAPKAPDPFLLADGDDKVTWYCRTPNQQNTRANMAFLKIQSDGIHWTTTSNSKETDLRYLSQCCLLIRSCPSDKPPRQTYVLFSPPAQTTPIQLTLGNPVKVGPIDTKSLPNFGDHGPVTVTVWLTPSGGTEQQFQHTDVVFDNFSSEHRLKLPEGHATKELYVKLVCSNSKTDEPPVTAITLEALTPVTDASSQPDLVTMLGHIKKNEQIPISDFDKWVKEEMKKIKPKNEPRWTTQANDVVSEVKQRLTALANSKQPPKSAEYKDYVEALRSLAINQLSVCRPAIEEAVAKRNPPAKDENPDQRLQRLQKITDDTNKELGMQFPVLYPRRLSQLMDNIDKNELKSWSPTGSDKTAIFDFPRLYLYERAVNLAAEAKTLPADGGPTGSPVTVRIQITRKLIIPPECEAGKCSADSETPESVLLLETVEQESLINPGGAAAASAGDPAVPASQQ